LPPFIYNGTEAFIDSKKRTQDIGRNPQKKMPYTEPSKLVNEFMTDNPSEWHYEMSSLISSAKEKLAGPEVNGFS
jgi:hypothetical protein